MLQPFFLKLYPFVPSHFPVLCLVSVRQGNCVLGVVPRAPTRGTLLTVRRQPGCITARIKSRRAVLPAWNMWVTVPKEESAYPGQLCPLPGCSRGAPQPLLEGKGGGLRAGQVSAGPSRADCHPRLTCACSLLLLWAPSVLVRGSLHPGVATSTSPKSHVHFDICFANLSLEMQNCPSAPVYQSRRDSLYCSCPCSHVVANATGPC